MFWAAIVITITFVASLVIPIFYKGGSAFDRYVVRELGYRLAILLGATAIILWALWLILPK